MSRKVCISRLQVYTDEAGEGFAYHGDADLSIGEEVGGGEDFGRIMVRLDVDGGGPIVYADLCRTGDLAGLMAAADALHRTIAQLSQMYPADGSQCLGQCLANGDWGRCRGEHGHDGDHLFPTESIWKAEHRSWEEAKGGRERGQGMSADGELLSTKLVLTQVETRELGDALIDAARIAGDRWQS